jgi:transcriptional regulator GlxA family with amidase domain
VESLVKPDFVFVPAIRSDDVEAMKRSVERLHAQWGDVLRSHHGRNGYLAGNCSAAFLLAEAGILDGRKATTSWFLEHEFRERYPRVRLEPKMLVTKEDRIFCAAAFSACFNLAVELVAEFLGPRSVLTLARVMLIDINRSEQLPYANLLFGVKREDDLVLKAQTMLLANLRRSPSLERLAGHLRITSRTLSRRFKAATGESPLTFLQKARIERAKRLLETTELSLDEIVYRVGYDDVSSFRRLFIRLAGISLGDYRRQFAVRKT